MVIRVVKMRPTLGLQYTWSSMKHHETGDFWKAWEKKMSHTESYYIVLCNHKTRSITERKESVIICKLHGQSPFYQGFHFFKRQMLSQPSASGLAPEWRAAVPSYATDTAAAHTRPPALWWCWCCLAHGHLRGCDAATFCTQIISSNGGHSKMIQNGNFHGEIMMIKKGIFFIEYTMFKDVAAFWNLYPTWECMGLKATQGTAWIKSCLMLGALLFRQNMSVSISDMAGWDGQTGHGATSLHQHPLPVAFKAKSRVTLESCGRSAFGELDGWRMQRLHILYSGSFNDKCRCRWQAYANAWFMSWYGLFGPQSHSINLLSVSNS